MNLVILPIKITFEVHKNWMQPEFTGSLWRGLFGHLLRATSCMTESQHCKTCSLKACCAYSFLFESEGLLFTSAQQQNRLPAPYAIRSAFNSTTKRIKKGQTVEMEMVLFGAQAIAQVGFVVDAWRNIHHYPIGNQKGVLRFLSMQWLDEHQNKAGIFKNGDLMPTLKGFYPAPLKNNALLNFQLKSPLRLKEKGHYLDASQITAPFFLKALMRRYFLLTQTYGESSNKSTTWQDHLDHIQLKLDAHWVELKRWSNRQHQYTPMSGILGKGQLQGELSAFQSALSLLPWCNLGKNASFGLGQFVYIESIKEE